MISSGQLRIYLHSRLNNIDHFYGKKHFPALFSVLSRKLETKHELLLSLQSTGKKLRLLFFYFFIESYRKSTKKAMPLKFEALFDKHMKTDPRLVYENSFCIQSNVGNDADT